MPWTVTLAFFLTGIAALAGFLLLPHAPKVLYAIGWSGLLGAYFIWLKHTYERKTALWTRGGPVRFDQEPRLYKRLLLLWLTIGIFAAFVVFVTSLNL